MTIQHLGSGQSVTVNNYSGPAISAAGSSVAVGTVVLSNSNSMSFGMNGSTITGSFARGGLSAGTASVALGTVVLSNSNGVSFGLNGSTVTASIAGGGGTVSAGTASVALGQVVLSNSNGVSFGLNGSTVTASVAGGGGGGTVSAGTASVALGQVVFSNANGVSFGLDGSTVTATVATNYLTTAMASNRGSDFVQATAALALTSVSATLASNGLSISVGPYLTTAMASNAATLSNINISAGTTSANLSRFEFGNSNAISFGLDGSTVTASYQHVGIRNIAAGINVIVDGTAILSNSNNVSFGIGGSTITASASFSQTNQQISAFAAGNTTQATSGTLQANSLEVRGAGVASVGVSNGSLVVSVPSGGGAGATTLSGYWPFLGVSTAIMQHSQGTLMVCPVELQAPMQFDRVGFLLHNTNSSNSSGSHSLSFWFGLYTNNASTLSLAFSASSSFALTHSGTAGSYSLYSGIRGFTIGGTTTMDAGNYWMGFVSRTTSGGANGSYSMACISQVNSAYAGMFGQAATATFQAPLGFGIYSASTSGMPGTIAFSQITGTVANARRFPSIWFASGTA